MLGSSRSVLSWPEARSLPRLSRRLDSLDSEADVAESGSLLAVLYEDVVVEQVVEQVVKNRDLDQESEICEDEMESCPACGQEGHADASDERCEKYSDQAGRATKRRRLEASAPEPGPEESVAARENGDDAQNGANDNPKRCVSAGIVWEMMPEAPKLRVILPSEAEAIEREANQHVTSVMQKLDVIWPEATLGLDSSVSVLDAFFYVIGNARTQIFEWTRKRMISAQAAKPPEEWELLSLMAMMFWLHLSGTSAENAFRALEGVCVVSRRSGVDAILSLDRFAELQYYLSAFDHEHPMSNSTDPYEALELSLSQFMMRRLDFGKHCVALSKGMPSTLGLCSPRGQGSDVTNDENLTMSCYDAVFPIHLFSVHSLGRARPEDLLIRALRQMKNSRLLETLSDVRVSFEAEGSGTESLLRCAIMGCGVVAKANADTASFPAFLIPACQSGDSCVATARLENFKVKSLSHVSFEARAVAIRSPMQKHGGSDVECYIALEQQQQQTADLSEDVAGLSTTAKRGSQLKAFNELLVADPERPERGSAVLFAEDYHIPEWTSGPHVLSIKDVGNADKTEVPARSQRWSAYSDEYEWSSQLHDAETSVRELPAGGEPDLRNALETGALAADEVVTTLTLEKIVRQRLEPITKVGYHGLHFNLMQAFILTEDTAGFCTHALPLQLQNLVRSQKESALEPSEEVIADHFVDQWIRRPKSRAPREALELVQNLPFVEAAFLPGLLHLEGQPAIGTAPSAICVVHGPGHLTRLRTNRILCPVEIFMCTLDAAEMAAEAAAAKNGAYVECTAGSKRWFELIPAPFRPRLFHAAAVLGTSCVLFCAASRGTVTYAVLVRISLDLRTQWMARQEEMAERFAKWAWMSVVGQEDAAARAADVPGVFKGSARVGILSKLRVWQALQRRCKEIGPVAPLDSLRSFAECAYASSRRGKTSFDRFVSQLRAQVPEDVSWESTVVTSKLLATVANSAVLWHANQAWRDEKLEGVYKFLYGDMGVACADFVEQLSLQLLSRAASLREDRGLDAGQGASNNAHGGTTSGTLLNSSYGASMGMGPVQMYEVTPTPALSADTHAKLRFPDKKRGVIEMANNPQVRQLRLSANMHEEQTLAKARRCVVCGEAARKHCEFCNVVLHKQIKYSTKQRISCWTQWHSSYSIKRGELEKKPRSLRNDVSEARVRLHPADKHAGPSSLVAPSPPPPFSSSSSS
ncbi:Hypothetical Protein FCC1311_023262 [Hondaea fermentalgiana]|uniref:Uncharacterized protein n=1 Tax=Hondaea fermentalgiana TaxID=2315210 RepID=A0A2R5G501_9STRA|nr:Hypothetical Protein FCC1311_023262 [Hondaea fermentalgiana]|eukprot:GBG26106.1 Hypothetical Protein FCC1311_023262 [Hondaea fermentalgiana]